MYVKGLSRTCLDMHRYLESTAKLSKGEYVFIFALFDKWKAI